MKTLNLSEIITANNKKNTSILVENLFMYKKSLYAFYKDFFCCEPILMVTDIFNACQYAKIVPANEFNEAVCEYIGCEVYEIQNNDDFLAQYENINFNSKFIKDFLN